MQMFLWTILISVLMIQRCAARMLVEQCGTPVVGPKILNGKDAEWRAAAWMVAIRNAERFQCGGTVIHRSFVLTAAHCIEDQSNLFVMLGAYNKSNPAQEYSVSLAVTHHGFNNRNMHHDIGLLKLSRNIQFGLYAYPICIVLNPSMKSIVENMNFFEAYGWGQTKTKLQSEILQKVTVYRFDRSKCNQYLDNNSLTSNQLCVGSWNGDTCRGDSGGPLTNKFVVRGKELQIQLAIVSFGKIRCDGAGVYTDVSSYANWIESNVNQYQWYTPRQRLSGFSGNVRATQVAPGSLYRPPPGFATNPPPSVAGSQNLPPHGFRTPGQTMFLYDQCSGDISTNFLVKIYGLGFEGKGVMITHRYVLTNAKDLPSVAATLEVLTTDENFFEELKVESIIKHPDFSGNFNHDIALLKLTKPVSLSDGRKPICMLRQARTLQPTAFFPMEIHPVASSECSNRINHKIEEDQLCIEEPEMTEKYGHTGDILGAKVAHKGKDWYILFGIVSYSSNGLIVLTNVMQYTYWIAGIVRNY